MLLSALTLAIALQAAPVAPTVVIPDAAPIAGRNGPPLARKSLDTAQGVDQLRMRSPKARRAKVFVVKPPGTSCDSKGLSRASHPEALTAQPLSKMPEAHAERAVVRLVDGCPVAVLIAQRTPAR